MHSCLNGKQLIIFDWDETLMNSREVARRASLKVIADLFGSVALSPEFVLDLGHSPCVLPFDYFDIFSDTDKRDFVQRFVRYHREIESGFDIVPGAKRVLDSLIDSNYILALATGRSRLSLEPLMRRAGISGYFSVIRSKEDPVQKPDAAVINDILAEVNCCRESALLVGDSRTDLQLAKNAGIDFLHATYHSYFDLDVPYKIKLITELID